MFTKWIFFIGKIYCGIYGRNPWQYPWIFVAGFLFVADSDIVSNGDLPQSDKILHKSDMQRFFFFSSFLHCRFQICVGEYLCRSEVPTTAQIPIKDRKLEIPTVVIWIPLRVCVNIPLGSMGRKTRNKSAINMQQILT